MATPHVAGVAGLLRMYFPDCKAFQIRNAMIITAKDKGDTGCDVNYGHGIVQAKAAFEYLEANQCDPNEAFKEPEGGCAEFSCSEDSDCDDGNPDTINTCSSGSCQSACGTDAACDDGDACTADTCSDGVCSSVLDCSICGGGASSMLELTTDNYPGETAWDIKNSSGDEKYNGSGYSDANTLHSIDMCLASDEYTFSITDAYGDGICCSYGNGGYVIKVDDTEVVNGGDFGDSTTETFTVNGSPPATAPVVSPITAPVTNPIAPPTTAPVTTPIFTEMLNAVNAERSNEGLGALCYNDKLINAAQIHSDDMAGGNFLSHDGSDGSSPFERITDAGFSWNYAAENIAQGQQTVESVMTAWMNSSGHRANILSSSSKYFGLGLAYSASNTPYWTQVFANSQSESCSSVTPAPVSPVTNPTAPPTTAPVTIPTAPPTTAPVTIPTAPPTTAPVTNPTAPPTAAPESTPSTAPVTAPSGCVTFGITLNTDAHGYETSFTLINDNTAVTRLAGGGYPSSMTIDEGTCLDNGRYIFTISDSYGDGMCCGSGQGGYELTLGGEVVKEGGQFGESESFVVEVGPQGPSRAPTPAPTCTQGGGACYVGDTCCSGRCGNSFCTYEE